MNYKDVLIRIRQATDSESTRYPVEAQIDGEGVWRGTSEFDFRALDPGRGSPRDYGIALGEQLLNSSIKRALEQAGAGQGQRVRIRLLVDDDVGAPLALRWERMYLDVGTEPWPIATSPEIAFSRYIPSERADAAPPDDTVFRILLAIANPTNLPGALQIDVSAAVARLFEEFRNTVSTPRFRIRVLPGRSGLSPNLASQLAEANWDIADGPATLENISRWVNRDGGYHALHIIAHGKFNPAQSEGILFLESNEGWMNPVKDYELEGWIHPKLQLMILQACKSAAQPPFGEPPFVAIAPKMVSFGVPAVVAMQDFVLMTDAAAFAVAFYRSLMREGLVDVAAGEGRQAMSRAASRIDPSIPALFTRLKGARLWLPDSVPSDVDRPTPSSSVFLCYRREDTQDAAGRLHDRLVNAYGQERVFMDIDSVPLGIDFVEHVTEQIGKCNAVIVMIGKQWQAIKDKKRRRRLQNEDDLVRAEIRAALQQKIPVIPVTVQNAAMPQPDDLPGDIRLLARRNGIDLSATRWTTDVERLIKELDRVMKPSSGR